MATRSAPSVQNAVSAAREAEAAAMEVVARVSEVRMVERQTTKPKSNTQIVTPLAAQRE